MNINRDKRIVNGFLAAGFDFKGISYRPLTARTLLLLEKAGSPFYFGGDQLRGLLDLLFISSHDSREILAAINGEAFDEVILDYAETFSPDDLNELGQLVDRSNADAAAAVVEVKEKAGSPKK
jgi:hypothetical protein